MNNKTNFNFEDNNLNLSEIYKNPFYLKIKVSNYDDKCSINIETPMVLTIKELPQNIFDIVIKHYLLQHYISGYSDEFYLHFNIKFISNNGSLDQFFSIKNKELKQMFLIINNV
jgi:hypothetical protein